MLLAERLACLGASTIVLTRRVNKKHPARETRGACEIVRVPPAVGLSRLGKYLMIPATVAALIRERHRFDILIVCDFKVLGVWGIWAARLLGKRVFLRAESCGEMDGSFVAKFGPPPPKLQQSLVRALVRVRNRFLNGSDGFLSISSAISSELRAAGVPQNDVIEITNGVDLSRFGAVTPSRRAELRRSFDWNEAPQVLFTGRLARGKGLEYLLEAWRKIAGESADAHLTLVGSGQGFSLGCEKQLKEYVDHHGLDASVTFTGNVTNVEEYLQAADLFVFPSESEGLGLSLVEAMACGLPSIATNVGGIVDIIDDGSNGLLVPSMDACSLYTAITRLLANPDEARRLGYEGRRKVERYFDIDRIAERYMKLLDV